MRDSLGLAGFRQVLKFNRIDQDHVRRDDFLIIPSGLREAGALPDSLFGSPFPRALAAAESLRKLVIVSIRVQAFAAYDHGWLIRWGPASTGRKATPTPAGLYHVNWKDEERASTINEEWLLKWCLNIDNLLGVSLHEYALPGWPASHSCVRLGHEDAQWLYDWAEQWKLSADGLAIVEPGTPVLVFGEYPWGRPPWKRLNEDPEATTVSAGEIAAALRSPAKSSGNGP
ncbi:MAG: L,D-transpeptidase [Candidatus Eisenbacteria bacterium]